MENLR